MPNEDTEPKRVSDGSENSNTEKSETEETVMNIRPVKADLFENLGAQEESSMTEDLAEKRQSGPELGLLVKLHLQSE